MPIPNDVKVHDCIGCFATVDRDVQNGAGFVIPKGTRVRIISVSRAVNITTLPCPHCGISVYVRGVKKNSLTLEK